MENRITIKFKHGYRPYVSGDVATVAKHEAEWFVRHGYAEIEKSPLEKEVEELSEVADPESVNADPIDVQPDQTEEKTEPETEKQAETAPAEDRAIHGPKTGGKNKKR